MIKILVVGLGNIGFRHFESLLKSKNNYEIYCYDKSKSALQRVRELIENTNHSQRVKIINNIDEINNNHDFLIHATSSDVRLKTFSQILSKSKIKFAILEKILAQNIDHLNRINIVSKNLQNCWVNTPMHEWDLYSRIKKKINVKNINKIEFNNFDGLACNAIHFIDFFSSWKKMLPNKIETSRLSNWYESKRKGFFDVFGKLEIIYPDQATLTLTSNKNSSNYHCIIKENKRKWTLIENEKIFFSSDGYKENGIIEYQSQLTDIIINKIITKGDCELPKLDWSIDCHRILINSLLNYWNVYFNKNDEILPIT